MQEESILKIEHLKTVFDTSKGVSLAVNDVSIDVLKGKIIGIVGESGCGKSVTAKSIMGLLKYPGRIESGSISFDGKDLTKLSDNELRDISGNDISMIFQEPMTSLNPVVKVGKQVREALMAHDISMNKSEAKIKVLDMFEKVGISDPAARYENYPFELSGGIRQRIMIAMAMICNPKLLIADEPTTALDVTIEAQILRLMKFLSTTYGMSIILITHSLGVVAQICDYVYVMYAGRIMEQSETFELFDNYAQPYTEGLMSSIPRIGENEKRLSTIPGTVPNVLRLRQDSCFFANRCSHVCDECYKGCPPLTEVSDNHLVRCIKSKELLEEKKMRKEEA